MKSKEFYQIIDRINWGANSNCEAIGEMLLANYNKETLRAFQIRFNKTVDKVISVLDRHAKQKCGNKYGYWDVSDDGFCDLTNHIAGLSKARFKAILDNPELVCDMVSKREYKENFSYIFQTVFPEDYR